MRELSLDISRRLDIRARKNQAIDKTFVVKNPDGSNFDFTGYTATMEVFTGPSDTVPNITFTVTLSSGELRIQLAANKIKRDSTYIYFLKLNGILWLNGRFIINEGLYEPGENTETLVINIEGTPITITISAGTGASAITGVNGIDVTDGIAKLGNALNENTTISGAGQGLSWGESDSKIQNLYHYIAEFCRFYVDQAFNVIVGTAQLIIQEAATAFYNDNQFEFRKPGDVDPVFQVSTKVDEASAKKITANAPLELLEITTAEQFQELVADELAGKYRIGSLAYYNISGIQPALICSFGGAWQTLNNYIDLGRYEQPSTYAPTSFLQALRNFELQGYLQPFDRLYITFVMELEEVAVSDFGIRIWHDPIGAPSPVFTDVCMISSNTPGRYVINVNVNIGVIGGGNPDNFWKQFVKATIVGPADENGAGFNTSEYPIQNLDSIDGITAIQVVGQCSLGNTLRIIHQDAYILRQLITV